MFLFRHSCSEDGSVVIAGLKPGSDGEYTPPVDFNYGPKWPMLAVRLDPLYSRRYQQCLKVARRRSSVKFKGYTASANRSEQPIGDLINDVR